MATIVDVAREAGVSVSTVSHVVNRTRRVTPATARAVQAASTRSAIAPTLWPAPSRRHRPSRVGIAISAIANAYFIDIICAIEAECARLGMMVFLSDTQDDPERELAVVNRPASAPGGRRHPGAERRSGAPRAELSARRPPALRARRPHCRIPTFDQVGVNNREAMQELVEHVAGPRASPHRLCRRASRLRRPHWSASAATATAFARLRPGVRRALSRHRQRDRRIRRRSATHALLSLDRPPTAIVAGNNMATIGAMRAIRARGLRVPQDISIVGFDDFEWADCFEPRLTLVAQPCEEIGRRAAALADGAHRRAGRRAAIAALDATPGRARFLREAAMNAPKSAAAPSAARHARDRQALRRRPGAPGRGLRPAPRRDSCAARRKRRRQVDADEHPVGRDRARRRRHADRRQRPCASPIRAPPKPPASP